VGVLVAVVSIEDIVVGRFPGSLGVLPKLYHQKLAVHGTVFRKVKETKSGVDGEKFIGRRTRRAVGVI
jgi:hypothetical protein